MLRRHIALSAALAAALFSSTAANAQVPGAPVLQNAFSNPGLGVAANLGGGSGQSFYGLAGAYGMGGGRLQLSAAAGAHHSGDATRGAYGARVSANVWTSSGGGLAAGAFAGVGGAPRTRTGTVTTNPAALIIPVGITAAYRRGLGATRGFSAYVSPLYRWTRLTSDSSTSAGSMRVSLGLDISITSSFGATVGAELGSGGGGSGGGNSKGSSIFGGAISWVPGRR